MDECVLMQVKDVKVLAAQSCATLFDPMDFRRPGSSGHGILQARILEWVTILFSRASSRLRDLPDSGIKPGSPALQADCLPFEPPEKPQKYLSTINFPLSIALAAFQQI